MKLVRLWCGALLVLAASACQERLATPTRCPELCPGLGLIVRDTVLTPKLGLDSTFVGYINANSVAALLASNGINAGEARAWALFPERGDSIFVNGVRVTYTVDSVGFIFNLIVRDTAARDLRLIVHRVPITVDTNTTLAELDAALTEATVIDSVAVHDTLRTGQIQLVVKGETLDRLAEIEADTGKLAIAVRVNAGVPTGVRLGAPVSGFRPPLFRSYVRAAVTDTAAQRQLIDIDAERANYVIETPPLSGPDVLFMGGRSGSRTILRFELPPVIKDSAAIVRATLELTPVVPLRGLPNDPGQLQVRPVLVDLGAKSVAVASVLALGLLEAGGTAVQVIDIASIVNTWQGPGGLAPALLLGISPEGGSFSRPEFYSSLGGANAPRLRITYALSTRPGYP